MSDRPTLRVRADQLTIHSGRTVLTTGADGSIDDDEQGLFQHDTRVLSHHRMRLVDGNGRAHPLHLLSAAPTAADAWLAWFAGPALDGVGRDAIVIRVDRVVGDGLEERITITNHSRGEARFTVELAVAADFRDAMWVRRQTPTPGTVERREAALDDRVEIGWVYRLADVERASLVTLFAASARVDGDRLLAPIALGPQATAEIVLRVGARVGGVLHLPTRRDADRAAFVDGAARVSSPCGALADLVRRATLDLASLRLFDPGETVDSWVPAAGLPDYVALFGRDALTCAWQAALVDPALLRGVVDRFAGIQGDRLDAWSDEQPGRVPHESRLGPIAVAGHNARRHYYGDVVATPLLLIVLAEHHQWTGDHVEIQRRAETIDRCLGWLDRYGDGDPSGFVRYLSHSPVGNKHQGWRDSGDAIRDARGDLVEPPVATCEAQGFAYLARLRAADLLDELGDRRRAAAERDKARALARRFERAFWLPDERFYALALDENNRPVRTISSAPGHLLAVGMLARDRAADVARRLLQPDLWSGFGVRTLSTAHPAYNPISYHLGTVWPVEQAWFAMGLRRYGFDEGAWAICEGLLALSRLFEEQRLPEVVGGTARVEAPFPALYPRANAPQAWSASAAISIVRTLLGIEPDAARRRLVVAPSLPPWLPEITVENLQVGDARLTLRGFRDRAGRSRHEVLAKRGALEVIARAPAAPLSHRIWQAARRHPGLALAAVLAARRL